MKCRRMRTLPPLLLPVEGVGGLERNGKYDCDLVARMRLPVGILSQTECLCLPRGLPGMGVESRAAFRHLMDARAFASKVPCKCFNYSLGMRLKSIEYDSKGSRCQSPLTN